MKPQAQLMMIALAIAFAVALILTIALLCMNSASRTDGPTHESTVPPTIAPLITTAPPPSTQGTTAQQVTTETTVATTEPSPILPDISNGLSFFSLGNGLCRVESIGTCLDACVVIPEYSPHGDRVVEIAEGAFFGCATMTAIQIPSSVKSIGDMAFAACKNLVYISVSDENEFYRDVDGVLYTADEGTLICYPSMHAGEDFTVRSCTTVIKDMAFYGCVYLKTVHYTGTAEQWEKMLIGSRNHSLLAASMTFASSVGK